MRANIADVSHEAAYWRKACAEARSEMESVSLKARSAIRADRNAFVLSKVDAVVSAAEKGFTSELCGAVQFFKKRTFRIRAALASTTGHMPESKAEEANNVAEHLLTLMQGTKSTYAEMVDGARAKYLSEADFINAVPRHAMAIVGPQDLALQFARSKAGKAPGPTMLPPEVLLAAPAEMAALMAPLSIKASMNILMPIQWQGAHGILIPKI